MCRLSGGPFGPTSGNDSLCSRYDHPYVDATDLYKRPSLLSPSYQKNRLPLGSSSWIARTLSMIVRKARS